MAMRSIGSIGSEICEMQRLHDANVALSLKDAEWQRRITARTPQATPPYRAYPSDPPHLTHDAALSPSRDQHVPLASAIKGHFSAPYAASSTPMPYSCAARPLPVPPPPSHGMARLHHDVGALPKREVTEIGVESLASAGDLLGSPPSSPGPSASTTHAHSPDFDGASSSVAATRRKGGTSSLRGIGKIRRHRMTKEEEARFAPSDLTDLRGSTAAKSRKMSEDERDIMLHKRRLRNRASAARSRDKQRKTINDVGEEVDELLCSSAALAARCDALEKALRELRARNEALQQENAELKQNAPNAQAQTMRKTGSTLRFSMSSDMLDKIIGGSTDGLLSVPGASSGMLRIPSKLHVSVSTDKLADGLMVPTFGAPVSNGSKNASMLDCLFDYANHNEMNSNGNIIAHNHASDTKV